MTDDGRRTHHNRVPRGVYSAYAADSEAESLRRGGTYRDDAADAAGHADGADGRHV